MTESEQKLNVLLRIRNVRVKKQMAAMQASEAHLNGKLNEQTELSRKIEKDREEYVQKQRQHTQKLLNNQSEIRDFLVLKNNEEVFIWNNKKMTRQGDALVEQIQQSRVDYQNEQIKFKALEKAVIKVEEFLKLDWK